MLFRGGFKVLRIVKGELLTMRRFERELLEKGFYILPQVDSEIIESLIGFSSNLNTNKGLGFHTSHFLPDLKEKVKIHEFLNQTIETIVKDYFQDYKIIYANFMIKGGGKEGAVPLHADWSYVDETQFVSYSIWLPLCNISAQNGGFGVVPYSHLIANQERGPNIHLTSRRKDAEIIERWGESLQMKKGEMLVYDHRLLHYSDVNLSEHVRVALNLSIVPNKVPLHHYYKDPASQKIRKYLNCDSSFYIKNTFGMVPLGENFELVTATPRPIDDRFKLLFIHKFANHVKQFFS